MRKKMSREDFLDGTCDIWSSLVSLLERGLTFTPGSSCFFYRIRSSIFIRSEKYSRKQIKIKQHYICFVYFYIGYNEATGGKNLCFMYTENDQKSKLQRAN